MFFSFFLAAENIFLEKSFAGEKKECRNALRAAGGDQIGTSGRKIKKTKKNFRKKWKNSRDFF